MSEETSPAHQPERPLADEIEELARHLRKAEHLEPETRAKAADLLRELAEALDRPEPSAQEEHLARSTAQLVRAVHEQQSPRNLTKSRSRLAEAVTRAESKAPLVAGIVMRLADVLAGIGI
jgi:hypothetical protein